VTVVPGDVIFHKDVEAYLPAGTEVNANSSPKGIRLGSDLAATRALHQVRVDADNIVRRFSGAIAQQRFRPEELMPL